MSTDIEGTSVKEQMLQLFVNQQVTVSECTDLPAFLQVTTELSEAIVGRR